MGARRSSALALTLSAVLGGCGAAAGSGPPRGRALFARECASCHSLDGGDHPRLQGGDLLRFHTNLGTLRQFTREMPVRGPLSAAELDVVVRYVAGIERRGRN